MTHIHKYINILYIIYDIYFNGEKGMLTSAPPQNLHRTKEEYVYATLRAAITRCDLKPGEKLVRDDLSVKLGVSQIPIRGALHRLQAEGLIEIIPHSGARISEISRDTINEIFMLLESLEVVAFGVAVTKCTENDITKLQQLVDEMQLALNAENPDLWYDLNNQFHLAVAQTTNMKMLIRFTTRVLDSRDRLRHFYSESFTPSRISTAQNEHRQMLNLLSTRNSKGLTELVTKHNRSAKQAYQSLIKNVIE